MTNTAALTQRASMRETRQMSVGGREVLPLI